MRTPSTVQGRPLTGAGWTGMVKDANHIPGSDRYLLRTQPICLLPTTCKVPSALSPAFPVHADGLLAAACTRVTAVYALAYFTQHSHDPYVLISSVPPFLPTYLMPLPACPTPTHPPNCGCQAPGH